MSLTILWTQGMKVVKLLFNPNENSYNPVYKKMRNFKIYQENEYFVCYFFTLKFSSSSVVLTFPVPILDKERKLT